MLVVLLIHEGNKRYWHGKIMGGISHLSKLIPLKAQLVEINSSF